MWWLASGGGGCVRVDALPTAAISFFSAAPYLASTMSASSRAAFRWANALFRRFIRSCTCAWALFCSGERDRAQQAWKLQQSSASVALSAQQGVRWARIAQRRIRLVERPRTAGALCVTARSPRLQPSAAQATWPFAATPPPPCSAPTAWQPRLDCFLPPALQQNREIVGRATATQSVCVEDQGHHWHTIVPWPQESRGMLGKLYLLLNAA